MPHHFEINKSHKVVRAVLEGTIDDAEMREIYRAVELAAPSLKPAGGILDVSAVSSFDVSAETIRRLASEAPAFGGAPRCIVAPSNFLYGVARLFQMLGGDTRPNLHIVRNAHEAHSKLGVPDNLSFERLPQE